MTSFYSELPIETDPEVLEQDANDYLITNIPDWTPYEGNLEVWMIKALARMTAETRDVAADVPLAIFRYFGKSLIGLPSIEASKATVASTWTVQDNAGYTIRAGTIAGIPRTGDELIAFEVVSDVIIPPGSTVTAAGAILLQAVDAGAAGSNLSGIPQLIDAIAWVTSIAMVGTTTGGVDAETDEAYISRLVSELQLLTPRPILARDFAVMARRIAGVARAVGLDGYDPEHNLLTLNQASVETDTAGLEVHTNATISRDGTLGADGNASLKQTAVAAGTSGARTASGANGIPVTANDEYTAVASFRPSVANRLCQVGIFWFDAANSIVTAPLSAAILQTAGVWSTMSFTARAPAAAVRAAVMMIYSSVAISEANNSDKHILRRGSSVVWKAGGSPMNNNERYVTVAAIDGNGNPVSSDAKAQIDTLLQEEREWNFVVHVIDPTYTTIDVTFTVRALAGYTIADVDTRAEQAVKDYLNPKNWGVVDSADSWSNTPVVRYLEMAEVLNRVAGVYYVENLTMRTGINAFASADVPLAGAIPMPQAGVVIGTVNAP